MCVPLSNIWILNADIVFASLKRASSHELCCDRSRMMEPQKSLGIVTVVLIKIFTVKHNLRKKTFQTINIYLFCSGVMRMGKCLCEGEPSSEVDQHQTVWSCQHSYQTCVSSSSDHWCPGSGSRGSLWVSWMASSQDTLFLSCWSQSWPGPRCTPSPGYLLSSSTPAFLSLWEQWVCSDSDNQVDAATRSEIKIKLIFLSHMQRHSEKIIFHELISTYICRTNEVISAVRIIIINIDCQLHVVVSITQLHQRNAQVLPLRIQTVHHSFCSSDLNNIKWQFYNPDDDYTSWYLYKLVCFIMLGSA